MFKICMIGCGDMATRGHGPAYIKYCGTHPDTLLAGCCDVVPEKAEVFREKFGFQKAYTDFHVMLDEIHPDVVCLISPEHLTSKLAVEVLKKGYALILEKPPGKTKEEILNIHRAALEAKKPVRVAFNRRYTPLMIQLKKWMGTETITNITYQMYRKGRKDADFATTAIHAIDAVKHIAGSDYEWVKFTYQEVMPGVVNIYMTAQMESGAIAQLTLVPMGGMISERATVNTNEATYYMELPFWKNPDSPGHLKRVQGADVTHEISGEQLVDSTEMYEESGFFEENRSWFDLLQSGQEAGNDLPSAIQSVDISNAIRERKEEYRK